MTAARRRDWSRVDALIDATLADTPISRLREVLCERLRAEFEASNMQHRREPSESALAEAEAKLRAMGI